MPLPGGGRVIPPCWIPTVLEKVRASGEIDERATMRGKVGAERRTMHRVAAVKAVRVKVVAAILVL